MTPTIERFNSTRGNGAPPRMGERTSMLDPADDRINRLMQALPVTQDPDMIDDELDSDIDMNAVRNQVADALNISRDGRTDMSAIQPTRTTQSITVAPSDGIDDLDLDNVLISNDSEGRNTTESNPDSQDEPLIQDLDEQSGDPTETDGKQTKIYAIAAAILVLIVVAIFIVSSFASKQGTTSSDEQQTPQQATSTQIQRYQTDTVNTTDSTTYQDSMIISKYFYFDQDTCVFVFEGYAENARAFVKAYVDVDTYNTYKTGARVSIIYDHIKIQGKDYYMKVRVI